MMKKIKLKLIAISCIFLILGLPVYTARVFAQDEQNEDKGIIVDNTPPSINIEKPPEKVTEILLNIKGTTNEPIMIEVILNSNYYGTISSNEDNTFSIGISLNQGENKIKINSTDAGGNSVINKFDVFCDSELPQIIYHNLYELSPAYTAKQTVKGQVNKPNIDIDVFVNENNKYSGKSDSDGNFEIDIKLEKSIKIGVTDKSITVGTQEGNQWPNTIKIAATDGYGRNSTIEDIIIYTLCGYGSDWNIKIGKITPDVVIPEHLIQGIAQFSFPINLTYKGRGDPNEVILTSEPQLTSYSLSSSSRDKYQEELFAGGATSYWNDDYTKGYFIVNLNAWPHSKEELNNLSFGLIKIPVRLDIYYEYENMNGDIVENTQRECWDIKIMIDKEIPLDKIPKKMLNATINILNSTINLIDTIKKPIDLGSKIAFGGCVVLGLTYLGQSIASEFSCISVRSEAVQALIDGEDTCFKQDEGDKVFDCDACLQSLKSLRKTEKLMNNVCDRIFCPAVPSLDYHTETYKDSITKKEINLCEKEGQKSDKCKEEYKRAWDSAFWMIDEWKKANAKEGGREESFFDKISEGLAFCEKAKEQEVTVITDGSGNKQTVYLVYPDGSVCKGDKSEVVSGTQGDFGIYTGKENEKDIFYKCFNDTKLNINETGYYTSGELEGKKIPSIVQSNRGIEGTDNYILDPTSDVIRSVQAVCLPAVSGYLNLWKQILEAVKQCFETIMITGEGSSGVCKAVLTTYVCDMIYDAIACAGGSLVLGADEEIRPGAFGVIQQIATGGKNVFDSVSNRYGQTGMYNTMFNERKLIHSICLFTFTLDWGEFDLDTMLSTEVGMPTLGSQGLLYPTTKRFLGSNPLDYGRTTYMYHIGAGIIAGADLNYNSYLKCSNDNSCTGGRCDCFYRGKEEIYNIASGSLSAGEMFNDEFFEKVVDSPVRYDKAVIEWDWIDNKGEMQTTRKVQNIEEAGERAPDDCKLDSVSGEFRCSYIIGKYGEARFVSVKPSGGRSLKDSYSRGEIINFDVQIEVESPEPDNQIPKYLIWTITDSENKKIKEEEIRLSKDELWEGEIPRVSVNNICCDSSEDSIDTYKLGDNPKLDLTIIERPEKYKQFAIVFTTDNYYKVYSVTKNGEWKIKENEPLSEREYNYTEEKGIIKYDNIELKLDSEPKKDDAAVIVLKEKNEKEGCIEGEEKAHVQFELFHSKSTGDQKGECCGKRIKTKDFQITVDCRAEEPEEEGN